MNRSTVNNINIKKFYFKRRRLFKNDNIARVTQKYNFNVIINVLVEYMYRNINLSTNNI